VNALFLSSRYLDAATVASSSELSSLPAANVQDMRPDKTWRAMAASAYLTVDFGADVAANALAVIWPGPDASATLRWRMASSAAAVTSAPAVDTTVLSAWPASGKPADPDWPYYFSLLTWSNSTGYRYGRLDIADAITVEVSRLFVGPKFVPTANVDLNPSLGLQSPGYANRTMWGKLYTDVRGPPSRLLTLPMSSIAETEMTDDLFELQRYAGVARDFAFCLDPAATTKFHKYSGQFRFPSLAPFQAQPFWNDSNNQIWQASLALEEVL
jgi:hypothetical protein